MSSPTYHEKLGKPFVVHVEAVPPAAGECLPLIERILAGLRDLPVDAVNLADSPMACPRMNPLAMAGALRAASEGKYEIIPHITVRDRNRVALQGLLWGAAADGIRTVLCVSGDPVHYSSEPAARSVGDTDVPGLVRMARRAGLLPGVVFDPRPAQRRAELRKLAHKVAAGAGFIITQPLFRPEELESLVGDMAPWGLPVILGVLPLVSVRHARFLNARVPGIAVPDDLLAQMEAAGERALEVGLQNARQMLAAARERLAGACIMPPFDRFNLVGELLRL